LDRVKEILNNPKIMNSKGNLPTRILIIPLYVAQVNEYRLRIKKLVNAGKSGQRIPIPEYKATSVSFQVPIGQ